MCWVFGVVLASAEPVLVPEICCAAGVLGLPLLTLFLHSHLYLRMVLLQLVIRSLSKNMVGDEVFENLHIRTDFILFGHTNLSAGESLD